MENQSPEQRERLWRKLSAAERADLRTRPELELEARLTDALARLPEAPLPSNFTRRVMAAIDFDEAQEARSARAKGWRWNWHSLLPKFAVVTAVLLFTGLGLEHYQMSLHRAEMAKSLSVVASAKLVPSMDALANLEAIRRMSQSAPADTELLTALQ